MFREIIKILVLTVIVLGLWTFGKSLRIVENVRNVEPSPVENPTPTSADNAPTGSIHNLPVPDAVSAVRKHIAGELGINEGFVIVMSAYKKDWPNSCLGLAEFGEFCAQVITPGYEVTASAQGRQFVYRVNSDGSILREER